MGSCLESLRRLRHNRHIALSVIGFALFLDLVLVIAIVPILPVYAESLGISGAEIGLLFSIKPIAGLVAAPLIGWTSDRVGRRALMIMGIFAAAAFSVLFAFATSFTQLLIARLFQGIASATNTAAFAFIADMYEGDPKGRSGAIGTAVACISMGVLTGPFFGGWLYEAGGTKLPFLIGAGLLALDGMGRIFVAEPRKGKQQLQQQQQQQGAAEVAAKDNAPAAAVQATPTAADTAAAAHESPSSPNDAGSAAAGTEPMLPQKNGPSSTPAGSSDADAAASDAVALQVLAAVVDEDTPAALAASVALAEAHDHPPPKAAPAAAAAAVESAAVSADARALSAGAVDSKDGEVSVAAAEAAKPVAAAPASAPPSVSYFRVVTHPQVLAVCGALFIGNACIALMEVILPLYLSNNLGLSVGKIAALYGGGNALYLLMTKPASWVGYRWGRYRVIAVGCIAMGVSMPTISLIESVYLVVPLWLVCAGIGMVCIDSCCTPELADVVERDLPGAYGRAFGFSQACNQLGFVLGPLLGTGLLPSIGYKGTFAVLGVVAFLYAPVLVAVFCCCKGRRASPLPPAQPADGKSVELTTPVATTSAGSESA